MTENFKTKKEELTQNIENLLKLIEERYDSSQSNQIYQNLIAIINEESKKLEQPKQKCKSCGEPLETWEKEICGPCKIADSRYQEDED